MFKLLIIICLIIQTHSWTWNDYPSPRGKTYWKCGVTKPTYVCDPDGMLTDQQREEIVELVEDFKEKTKRLNALYQCWRDGLRLVVALAKNKIGPDTVTSNITNLCHNDRSWTLLDITDCKTNMLGIELNTDGFRYCYQIPVVMTLNEDEFRKLNNNERTNLKDKDYFDALKGYIENFLMLYIHRLSIFDNDASISEIQQSLDQQNKILVETTKKLSEIERNKIKLSEMRQSFDQINKTLVETKRKLSEMRQSFDQGNKTLSELQTAIEENKIQLLEMKQFLSSSQIIYGKNTTTPTKFSPSSHQLSNNLLGIISIIFCLIIGLVLLFLICQFRQFKNYLNQRNASKTETQLMTPIQPVEIVEKRRENEENEEATKALLNL
uniref:Uncharacterized protein n=1 Tax=Meloidogyne enterolobii TaxID=390850 RepID=A0A6V7VYC0_MELEN|nr:unnamed protein product [Meloidogyne enterolobii]